LEWTVGKLEFLTGWYFLMIQLRRAGLVADRADIERLRSHFEKTHWVRIPEMLDPQLLSLVLSYTEQGHWRDSVVSESFSYSEYALEPGAAVNLLHFVINSPGFLETIREITRCSSLTWFQGRCTGWKPMSAILTPGIMTFAMGD
jgi:hypothetical protein